MKDFDYYSIVDVEYPKSEDFKKYFVYSKGVVILNGVIWRFY